MPVQELAVRTDTLRYNIHYTIVCKSIENSRIDLKTLFWFPKYFGKTTTKITHMSEY